ncbi:helix-turn-helix domain-containing protein [Chryseobacterium gallinarum]|uniref:Helix-turn-helix domain-containing protein n=1 Tax=Chryseobacterium gallinarum TaxID=1324352 RepID=A0ABX6KLG2_CHRGL|nr:helix-turn-helix domain-containing protein [Chryseobacterium gallinarum]QIY89492.1 helix-turn-helix domain-containing protein [Chryseobacterium gallinarum]
MKKNSQPDYKRIYSDIIDQKFPHKKAECEALLGKTILSAMDILELNKRIFNTKDHEIKKMNQKLRSYHTSDILRILNYQKNHSMSNSCVAQHFGLSKNTIAKWKKLFKQ